MTHAASASGGVSIPFLVIAVVSVAAGLALLYLDYRGWRGRRR